MRYAELFSAEFPLFAIGQTLQTHFLWDHKDGCVELASQYSTYPRWQKLVLGLNREMMQDFPWGKGCTIWSQRSREQRGNLKQWKLTFKMKQAKTNKPKPVAPSMVTFICKTLRDGGWKKKNEHETAHKLFVIWYFSNVFIVCLYVSV